eukprot:maker-scaffold_9-snap-gene-7.21-mRNA-1 protein AED:0.01 eAED:0.01 QI:113/1/1/1/1/1/2/377/496
MEVGSEMPGVNFLNMFKPTSLVQPKFLGRGSYGTVVSVVGRLDNTVYALKRIKLKRSLPKKCLREVKILSCLNHRNILRYFNAWIQVGGDETHELNFHHLATCTEPADGISSLVSLSDTDSECDLTDVEEEQKLNEAPVIKLKSVSDKDDFLRHCFLCEAEYQDFVTKTDQWRKIDKALHGVDLCMQCYLKSYQIAVGPISETKKSDQKPIFMYIQNEYCELNLKDFLRNFQNDYGSELVKKLQVFLDLAQQFSSGLNYLHSEGVVHRDLKPANVFIKRSWKRSEVVEGKVAGEEYEKETLTLKVGDLGAASFVEHLNFMNSLSFKDRSMVGTTLYLSPESAKRNVYSMKSDMYSFGVIVLEILLLCLKSSDFSTEMERLDLMQKIKNGDYSGLDFLMDQYTLAENGFGLRSVFEELKSLLRSILTNNVAARATAREVEEKLSNLKHKFTYGFGFSECTLHDFCSHCLHLESENKRLEAEVERLRGLLISKEKSAL